MTLDDLNAEALEALVEALADLRHDLGKYVTFEVRFVGRDVDDESLRRALIADITRTRQRGAHQESAWQLWARMRPGVIGDDADVTEIDAAMVRLKAIDLATADRAQLDQAADEAVRIAGACRSLLQRAATRADALEG
ncbi:MAG: hypothetical protein AAFV53_38160 [Myxococcota bacterium]